MSKIEPSQKPSGSTSSTVDKASAVSRVEKGKSPAAGKGEKSSLLASKKLLIIGGAVIGLIVVAAIIGVVVFLVTKDGGKSEEAKKKPSVPWHTKDQCPSVAKCPKSDYSKPPLMLISIDGYRRDYLDQPGWVKWLDKVADCGVRAEKVLPVYPSKTFPNHYSQVTGQYPIYHGLIENNFLDRTKNPPEGITAKTHAVHHFKSLPIWKHYMAAGGRAHCYFWPGSDYHTCTEHIKYDGKVKPEQQVEKVREWLNLPEDKRPGLLTMYIHRLDDDGHNNTTPDILKGPKIGPTVKYIDQLLHDFFQALSDDDILNCVNVLVMGDHGMTNGKNVVQFNTKLPDYYVVTGNIPQLYNKQGTVPLDKLKDDDVFKLLTDMEINLPTDTANPASARCENNRQFLVTTDANRPPRHHYSGSDLNGDVMIEGRPGYVFQPRKWEGSVHGYDYIQPDMQTIFFARGPAFRQGVVLPPFQQVEYFNLMLDLLGMERIASNGTEGIFDPAMVNPPKRNEKKYTQPEKCSTIPPTTTCPSPLTCPPGDAPQLFSPNLDYCFIPLFCQKVVYSYKGGREMAVMETVTPSTGADPSYAHLGTTGDCNNLGDIASMSADPNVKLSSLLIPTTGTATSNFTKTTLIALNEIQNELLGKASKLYALSGAAVDKNRDVQADNEDEPATHFYRLYVYCEDGKYSDKAICQEKDQLATLGFIFPLIEEDLNCLKSKDLLLYYSARLKDVETISGLELMLDGYTDHEKAVLRTKIVEQL